MRNTAEAAARTREKILRAALQRFASEGWNGTSFVGVAEQAGVTRGAVHHHFTDKTALLHAALAQAWQDHPAPAFAQLQAEGTDPRERLVAFVAGYLDALREDPEFRTLAVVSTIVAPQSTGEAGEQEGLPEKQVALSGWSEQIRHALKELSAQEPLALDLDTAVFLIASTTYGVTVSAALGETPLPDSAQSRALAERLIRTVTAA
jgi:AcrR family transcriptional regulator